ncbi:MAG: L-threonylcarbamoyladenylate synthase [Bacteroidales bacterium]|nr:L-threonylcarbamoyladenylate synthase [Bacteroidales bacterium]
MKNLFQIDVEIKNCIFHLQQGNVILCPTDTIWGLSCDATNPNAINKINKIKGRTSKPYIILVHSMAMVLKYVKEVPEVAYELVEKTEEPLTIIYPQAKNLPEILLPPDKSIAIRIVKNEFCNKLIKQFKKPIVSTSANFSNDPPPLSFKEINEKIKSQVDYIVNYNIDETTTKKPSKIIKVNADNSIIVIRE